MVVNNEREGMLKEVVLALRYCPGILREGLRKATKTLRIITPGGVSNRAFPECLKRCRWYHGIGSTLHSVASSYCCHSVTP